MAGRGPSRQELIRRRRSNGFIGRQGEVAGFRDALKQPLDEAAQFLFHVRGPAGVGKSTLVRQLETIAREGQAVTAYVDEAVADAVEAMEVISAQLAQQGTALKGFDKLLSTYRQRRHEADAGVGMAGAGTDPAAGGAHPPSPSSVIASQLGLVGLGMIPGVGAFTGAVDPNQVAAGADRVKALLSTRLRTHGDVDLVLSPLDALTPVFLEELAEVARRNPWVVLFFDTYERTGPMLDTWLRDVLVSDRYGELPANVLVTLAGQSRLAARCWEDWHDLVTDWPLEVFTDAEARQLLAGKGVTDERVVEVILRLSGRLPVLVSTLAESQPGSVEEIGDPSGTAVERFLKWEADPARRAAALACAFPQELDEDVFRTAVEEEAAELFGWLRSMPFVTDRSGHCRYHEVVRSAMLRLQRRQSPARWEQLHTRLADAFRQRRARLEEAAAPADGWWEDERWRAYRLQETYHRLCADPRSALPGVLRELLDAYDHDTISLSRWAQAMITAGRDCDEPAVTGWGERILTALGEEPRNGIAVLTVLLTRGDLDRGGQALALTLRGRDHRNADTYPQALADYTQALALDLEGDRAFFGRGRTYQLMGMLDEAIADYSRAVEVNPEDVLNVSYRGLAYQQAERYEEALADFDRSLELKPDYDWALTSRGHTLRSMKRYEEALSASNRAIDIAPDSAWALTNRGVTFGVMERHEEALADFTRAIELKADSAWAFACQGDVYRSLGRYEEAVAAFTRAVELSPDYQWAMAGCGYAYTSLGRYEEAVAAFTRAIELDAGYDWALAGRGDAYRWLGRHEEAVADLTRAVELDPAYHWAFARRGDVYHSLGRYEEAEPDFTRAIELKPDYGWALTQRGLTRTMLDRHEEALADYDLAVELDPDDYWAVSRRGMSHRMSGRYEAALADFTRSVELRSDAVWSLTSRGLVHRLLGHYDAALTDLTRATDLEPDDAWALYETAVVLHAVRHPDRDGHLARVVELLTPAAPEETEETPDPADMGNLLLAHCLWGRWEEAEQDLIRFLRANPPRGQVHELLLALRSLIPLVPSAESRIVQFCRTVEDRRAGFP
ncbi:MULTISPECIES: tetratricopeptide repeat protein [unclassified Streptomyces]|uniref:tetratricopeptide repeat protein n=1 Tax=unclassified Streptomyces TaxID=2593676 RepID=UPI001BEC00BF|nr:MULTISPECIES: tetratricopeptide repeat protein [unclassified Streptomyces]MBT2402954.1 tetratricopeptide repeat protein [Streptomyces sp. ISL-21]MBT2609607.1 tetratricopeptide repeat protein [Streptomyces sp. ISL-87]